ncbi:elongation of very long chain fatty acids protein AAEL008004-like [Nylanderia fulva]|uniref:elongation of very long chain fatty acids protein AAEL008004-like n=1 Tax=Nylanderia fulva TaxID=613905 RepID=UPI0010FBAAF9|nr:elongation of very long chain fatty acids protein AAEL008004-like [Nylanderia fulva]XP_029158271.1 elongation of very long chain fatty acids protein AAEL008004-like [Nylanderia fulva]
MTFLKVFHYYWTEMADQRTNNWLLINSTYQIPFLLIAYMYFVLRWGPQYMKNRPPYSLKTFMKFYNVFQIIANAWLVYEHIAAGWFTEISLTCVPDYSYKPGSYKLATIMWWILLLKLVDLIETVIFVVRKKHNQISFLHVYHHMSNCIFIWIYTKYIPGEMSTFITLLNCFVHVLMYIYYLLATFGPPVQKVINPIKPSLTILQMVQFIILIIYASQSLFPSCPVPGVFGLAFIGNMIINLFLFCKFYKNSYIKSKNTVKFKN